jgi:pyruvate formate lyase activating enzyme
MEKEAVLWKHDGSRIVCTACARRCSIPKDSNGFCFVRQNRGGKLVLANYGVLEAMQIDPIEKKPFNHFMPGTYVLGIGTSSCNWGCLFCQNHNISKEREIKGTEFGVEQIVDIALENGVDGIAYTYNEPTIFMEFVLDVARAAHDKGLFNVFVTNGYMTKESICMMKGLVDAVVVNLKGNGEQKFANKYEVVQSNEPVKEALVELKRAGIHVELTDLIIPLVGDSLEECRKLSEWVVGELGKETPIHFTRFYPDYKMLDFPSTPYETLLNHHKIAVDAGLKFVYIGNVVGNGYGNTYCPSCGKVCIRRDRFSVVEWKLNKHSGCESCAAKIPIVGEKPKTFDRKEIVCLV